MIHISRLPSRGIVSPDQYSLGHGAILSRNGQFAVFKVGLQPINALICTSDGLWELSQN